MPSTAAPKPPEPKPRTPRRKNAKKQAARTGGKQDHPHFPGLSMLALAAGATLMLLVVVLHSRYTINWRSPVTLHFRLPFVIADRDRSEGARLAQFDQNGHGLTAYQAYACEKFGSDCRVALAIQRAENPQGKCEIYHYNTDGTLDWGYFQINTVHLKRPGLNLRDLLDCKANIDFAYQLYLEQHGFTPWSTYNSGAYKRYLRSEN